MESRVDTVPSRKSHAPISLTARPEPMAHEMLLTETYTRLRDVRIQGKNLTPVGRPFGSTALCSHSYRTLF